MADRIVHEGKCAVCGCPVKCEKCSHGKNQIKNFKKDQDASREVVVAEENPLKIEVWYCGEPTCSFTCGDCEKDCRCYRHREKLPLFSGCAGTSKISTNPEDYR